LVYFLPIFLAVVGGWEFAGLLGFLKGVSGKLRVWAWFFDGENVVGCVVNVVF
jgi:hypothetical protein